MAHTTTAARNLRLRAAYRAAIEAVAEADGRHPTDVMLGRKLPFGVARRRAGAKYRHAAKGGLRLVRRNALARSRALYLTVTAFDIPARALAGVAELSESAVRYALRRIEDARDDPDTDRALDELQSRVMA
jgi:hypothetical protein